ncbi:MAG: helix-turn-helix domain-containing protein [Oscillospiraceae bacterium]|nr:helix-turn-helix domain-containing protein [Oscillospiraceae bacterium]
MTRKEGVDSVSKTLRLLELMAGHNGELTVTQIAEQLDCSISSANRFLQTLEEEGFAGKNPVTRHYELNRRLYVLGAQLVANDPNVKKLIPLAHAVSQKYDVSVNINTMLGKEALLLFRVTRHYNKDLDFLSAETAPAYCTSCGKVIMAQWSEAQLSAYFNGLHMRAFQKQPITEEALREELRVTRRRGYALCQEEYVSGVFSISFPYRDLSGHDYAFTLIVPMRDKKRIMQPEILREIRQQLQTL